MVELGQVKKKTNPGMYQELGWMSSLRHLIWNTPSFKQESRKFNKV